MIIGIIQAPDLGAYHPLPCDSVKDIIKAQLMNNVCLANVKKRRENKDFISTAFLQVDFDGVELDPLELSKSFNFRHWILKSKSDGKDGKRSFHLFVILDRSIKNVQHYNQALSELINIYSLPYDEKAKDAVRFFWKHTGLIGGKLRGVPFYQPSPYVTEIAKDAPRIAGSGGGDCSLAIYNYSKKHNRKFDLMAEDGRWKQFNSLLGVLRKMGFQTYQIKEYVDSISRYEDDSSRQFTKAKVHRFIDKH